MTDYLFIDMHLHSKFSDEDLCDESPKHILKKVQGYCDKYNEEHGTNVSCVISIADHNSILGCVSARKELENGNYPNVKFVNGCEFTVDLCEVNDKIGVRGCFTRCHLHGYCYDHNNAELQAYSKIAHKRFNNEDNIGLQICAARRAICEEYGINVPFVTFLPLVDLPQHANYVNEFIKCIKAYFSEIHQEFHISKIYSLIENYLISARTYVEDSTSYGRVKLSEAMRMINDAGGKVVLAHPTIMSVSVNGIRQIYDDAGLDGDTAFIETKKLCGKRPRVELSKLDAEAVELVLNKFLDETSNLCSNVKIEGMETYYGVNFIHRNDIPIHRICAERGLFETAGSDYHGENFINHKTIGNVFQQYFQRGYGKSVGRTQTRGLFVRIANLPYLDSVLDGDKLDAKKDCKFIDENLKHIPRGELNAIIDDILGKPIEKLGSDVPVGLTREQQNYILENGKEIRKHIATLISIAQGYEPILNKSATYKERRRKLLKLEVYCQAIYKGIASMQQQFRDHAELFEIQESKQVQKYLKEIHRKYYEMLRLDNGIMYDLEKSLKKQYGINGTTIDKIANITIQKEEPQKDEGREG